MFGDLTARGADGVPVRSFWNKFSMRDLAMK